MKNTILIFLLTFLSALLMNQTNYAQTENPFFTKWTTPFEAPPFDKIKNEHYKPAYIEGMKKQNEEIAAITANPDKPTFENTLVALEKSGNLLTKVSGVFNNLMQANADEEMQKISQELSPLLSKHYDDINLNEKLFARIKFVHDSPDAKNLNPEQKVLLDKYYKDFVKRGANLSETDKDKLRKINEELSLLTIKFDENDLKETNAFELVIDNEEDLSGLPPSAIAAAKEAAEGKGYSGKWLFTLHAPSYRAFIRYADNRSLREKIYNASKNIANNNNENDNKKIVENIVSLRLQKANLLGYKSLADMTLEDYMAKDSKTVDDFLIKLWEPTVKKANTEIDALKELARSEGMTKKFEPWDLAYYAQKLKVAKYSLDDEMVKPYFKLDNVLDGLFTVVNKLYGLKFEERKDIPAYHPDVKVIEIKEADGKHLGLLYADYFPRETKQGGAWCNVIRDQNNIDGHFVSPIIINCGNFSKPTSDKPALLSLGEVETIFHEFGHGLHALFTNVTYPRLTGFNVAWDFVELPSQIMENWVKDPTVLKMFAKHYKTGEVIPDDLLAKIKKADLYNTGILHVSSYLFPALIDMEFHARTKDTPFDVNEFDNAVLKKFHVPYELSSPYPSTQNGHIFTGGYAAGYYSYIWAAVLDADAFSAFKESGDLFNPTLSTSFRKNILSRGATDEPMTLFKNFRGREPKVEPLIERNGLK